MLEYEFVVCISFLGVLQYGFFCCMVDEVINMGLVGSSVFILFVFFDICFFFSIVSFIFSFGGFSGFFSDNWIYCYSN